jgi:hypothetical protein
MDESDSSMLNQRIAAIEKATAHAHAYRAQPLRYAELFKLHDRLKRQAAGADADSGLTRAGPEHAVVRERPVVGSPR